MHKLLWDFEIQMDHLILARWPDLVIVKRNKRRTWWIVDFVVPADQRVKVRESENRHKYLDLARELKKETNYGRSYLPNPSTRAGYDTRSIF